MAEQSQGRSGVDGHHFASWAGASDSPPDSWSSLPETSDRPGFDDILRRAGFKPLSGESVSCEASSMRERASLLARWQHDLTPDHDWRSIVVSGIDPSRDFGTSGGYLFPIGALPLLSEAARREDRRRHNWAMRAYTDRLLDASENLAHSLYGYLLPPSVSRYLSRRERVLDDVDPAGIGEPGPW